MANKQTVVTNLGSQLVLKPVIVETDDHAMVTSNKKPWSIQTTDGETPSVETPVQALQTSLDPTRVSPEENPRFLLEDNTSHTISVETIPNSVINNLQQNYEYNTNNKQHMHNAYNTVTQHNSDSGSQPNRNSNALTSADTLSDRFGRRHETNQRHDFNDDLNINANNVIINEMSSNGNNKTQSNQLIQPLVSHSKSINTTKTIEGDDNHGDKNYYQDLFMDWKELGKGGYGTVYKVVHTLDGGEYAIKVVKFNETSAEHKHRVLNEVKSLVKVRSQYVVQYYNSWLDNNLLYILMEYCPQSLRSVLTDKRLAFGRQSAEPMNAFEYYMSCEIFKELLQCVQYLHERSPQIIHRDLNPDNVLIAHNLNSDNNRCIKLCDFGLATLHDPDRHYRTKYRHTNDVGTVSYQAPEVAVNKKYGHKSDVYSVALIGGEIFDVDLYVRNLVAYPSDHVLKTSVECLHRRLQSMTATIWDDRPECREVLAKHNEWSINKSVITTTDHDINRDTGNRYEHSVVGSIAYMAPEVTSRSKYNHKSDIYSLSLIGQQLFAIDLQASQSFDAKESVFKTSILSLYQTLAAMMSTPNWRQRPECRQVLAKYNEWSIDKTCQLNCSLVYNAHPFIKNH
ncbi:unnamed protein product [Medioppia subpectinata]|uniref:Protein kinase domain-containing protein n=1 Tax=Medioppia subpectinata TaxID=1979941 RepID=A0A7R9L0T1_9ACAR|nr:unnamed protein product [Medioppia subpectinata]CAG2113136.1 unnamed protein product [Medioppia subpectinata]